MKKTVEVIMDFKPDGSCEVVTIKGMPDKTKCKAVADQFAELNGLALEETRKVTSDLYTKPSVEQKLKQQ